ncbi:hypothetical protein GCM10027271_41680 [Saccharopolyspora gloriosae]
MRGRVVARGEDFVVGADGQPRGGGSGGADVVEVELEQPRFRVRGREPDCQRAQRVVVGGWCV